MKIITNEGEKERIEKGKKSEGKNGEKETEGMGQKCNNAPLERVSRRKEVHTQLCHVGTD